MIKKIFTLVFLGVLTVGLGLLVLGKLGEVEEPAVSIERVHKDKGLPVEVTGPVVRGFRDYLYCNGEVVAHDRAVVRAKISEVVEDVNVREGERVEEGQVLVELRTADLQSALDAAEQAYQEARDRLERYRGLLDKGVVSQERFDELQTAYNRAESALQNARSRMEFATLASPIEGIVEERMVEPGEYTQARDQLFTIVGLDALNVKAQVPERFRAELEPGMPGEFQLRSRTADETWFQGVLTRLSPASNNPNRFFDVFVYVEPVREQSAGDGEAEVQYGDILPGMYAEARFVIDRIEDAVGVPGSSVVYAGAERFVYTVRTEEREVEEPVDRAKIDNSFGARLERGLKRLAGRAEEVARTKTVTETVQVARRVDVEPGLRDEGMVQLLNADLSPDTRIIVNPSDDVRDGSRVRIVDGEGDE